MMPSVTVVVAVFAAPAANLPTEFWQVAPDHKLEPSQVKLPRGKDRAVLLIPGLMLHPLRPQLATRPELHAWQEPASELVRLLAKDFDVFAFGYAQNTSLDAVAQSPGLRSSISPIREAGYKEIILVGHSAGGVISQLFTESHPDAGITKIIAVSAPFKGSELANLKGGYPRVQALFVQSLSPEARAEAHARTFVPPIEMACVVCKLRKFEADGLVNTRSQWPAECRRAGVPAVLSLISHFEAMSNASSARKIAELAREKLTRWTPEEVDRAIQVLYRRTEPRSNPFRRNDDER
jgi:pimeloyl-ACP methyl ester carboxylesterase